MEVQLNGKGQLQPYGDGSPSELRDKSGVVVHSWVLWGVYDGADACRDMIRDGECGTGLRVCTVI